MGKYETKDISQSGEYDPGDRAKQEDKVNATHPAYLQWMDYSLMSRSLMQGTRGMKEQQENFLPNFEFESKTQYETRLANSVLLNGFRKTVSFLGGQVFQSDISFTDEFPDQLLELNKDVDLVGSTIEVFSKRVFEEGLANGVSHIYVEAPAEEPGQTRADDKESGARPYFRQLLAENLIGWQTDGAGNIVQIRFAEVASKPVGVYGEEFVEQIRVLVPGGWMLFEKQKNKFAIIDEGSTSLDYIPLVTYIPENPLTQLTAETPLQDLADLNVQHWRSLSDQINILHISRVPILFGRQVDLTTYVIGSSKGISSDDEKADLKFVEVTGKAIEAGQKDLDQIEAKMALYGLQQMIPRTGTITATEKALSAAESNSSLATWTNSFQDAITEAYRIAADYMNAGDVEAGMVTMPTDFDKFIADPAMISALESLSEKSIISKQEVFEAVNQMGILRDGISWDDIAAEIEEEARTNTQSLGALTGLFGAQNPAAPAAEE